MGSTGTVSTVATKLANMNKEGEYRYHGTSVNNLEKIGKQGLLPSSRGMAGQGVYFAYNMQDARDWGKEQAVGNIVTLRVANTYLANTSYEDVDDIQGVSPDKVPASAIEIRQAGKWVPLKTFLKNWK